MSNREFLVDNALSPVLAERLTQSGHVAVHVSELGLAAAMDAVILEWAAAEQCILVSADHDFATLLALGHRTWPSLILFRGENDARPDRQASLILANLSSLSDSLREGCVAVFESGRIRVRSLPILGDSGRLK